MVTPDKSQRPAQAPLRIRQPFPDDVLLPERAGELQSHGQRQARPTGGVRGGYEGVDMLARHRLFSGARLLVPLRTQHRGEGDAGFIAGLDAEVD